MPRTGRRGGHHGENAEAAGLFFNGVDRRNGWSLPMKSRSLLCLPPRCEFPRRCNLTSVRDSVRRLAILTQSRMSDLRVRRKQPDREPNSAIRRAHLRNFFHVVDAHDVRHPATTCSRHVVAASPRIRRVAGWHRTSGAVRPDVCSKVLPINPFRDVPIRIGKPSFARFGQSCDQFVVLLNRSCRSRSLDRRSAASLSLPRASPGPRPSAMPSSLRSKCCARTALSAWSGDFRACASG